VTEGLNAEFDPLDLWEPASRESMGMDEFSGVSFGVAGPGDTAGDEEASSPLIWRICSPQELEAKAQRVQAVQSGLTEAETRAASFVAARGIKGQAAGWDLNNESVSYDIAGSGTALADSPEEKLLWSLVSTSEGAEPAGGMVSFGLLDHLPAIPNWGDLQGRFNQLMDSVNRQLLHFAWVDTLMAGVFLARTTINWGGDMTSVWAQGVLPGQVQMHNRSLALAVQSRHNNLRTVTTVARLASGLALAFSTPLGAARLMALSWQFIHEVLVPFLQTDSEEITRK
jgi:hypothetical protein